MERARGFVVSGLMVWVVAAAGCAPARMAVPKDVGAPPTRSSSPIAAPPPARFVDESFKMGPYQVVGREQEMDQLQR